MFVNWVSKVNQTYKGLLRDLRGGETGVCVCMCAHVCVHMCVCVSDTILCFVSC